MHKHVCSAVSHGSLLASVKPQVESFDWHHRLTECLWSAIVCDSNREMLLQMLWAHVFSSYDIWQAGKIQAHTSADYGMINGTSQHTGGYVTFSPDCADD